MIGMNQDLSAADVAAVVGNNRNNGGNGFLGDEGGLFWIIILFLFAMMSGNWGNNAGNNGGGNSYIPAMMAANSVIPATTAAVQQGFDQASIMNSIGDVAAAVNNGFAGAEISRCNSQANLTNQLTNLGMSLQNCCCENRAATADLKYSIASEACADRQAVNDGVRDLLVSGTNNTQNLLNAINAGIQGIQDKLCAQELEAERRENANLRTQLNLASLRESQTAQTSQILSDNARQTAALEQYLNPAPIPAYVVQNPNGCGCECNQNTGYCGSF